MVAVHGVVVFVFSPPFVTHTLVDMLPVLHTLLLVLSSHVLLLLLEHYDVPQQLTWPWLQLLRC